MFLIILPFSEEQIIGDPFGNDEYLYPSDFPYESNIIDADYSGADVYGFASDGIPDIGFSEDFSRCR